MELSDKEKLKLSVEGIEAFLSQFPKDVYSNITLDVLLNELYYYSEKNDKKPNQQADIHVSGEERQKGN